MDNYKDHAPTAVNSLAGLNIRELNPQLDQNVVNTIRRSIQDILSIFPVDETTGNGGISPYFEKGHILSLTVYGDMKHGAISILYENDKEDERLIYMLQWTNIDKTNFKIAIPNNVHVLKRETLSSSREDPGTPYFDRFVRPAAIDMATHMPRIIEKLKQEK
jgi:hypothetical protein